MSNRALVVLGIALTQIVSCSGDESDAQGAVRSTLIDPNAAQFGAFEKVGESFACLRVNSRNRMGGYTGEQQAMLAKLDGNWHVIQIEKDLSHQQCVTAMSKMSLPTSKSE